MFKFGRHHVEACYASRHSGFSATAESPRCFALERGIHVVHLAPQGLVDGRVNSQD